MKPQLVRIFDVWLIGPLMMTVALKGRPGPWLKSSMYLFGFLTIIYNLDNYLQEKEGA